MKRLVVKATWSDDGPVYYMGEHVGDIVRVNPAVYSHFEFNSKDGSYATSHWSLDHLKTHLRGYYDRLTIQKSIKGV